VPMASFDSEQAKHPAAFRLNQVYMPFTANLVLNDNLSGDKDVTRTVLTSSTDRSWLIEDPTIPLDPRRPQEWQMGPHHGPFPLVVALSGRLPSAFKAEAMSSEEGGAGPRGAERAVRDVHVFVVGSAGFLRDEFLPPPDRTGQRDLNSTLALGLNSIDWLAQEDALIAIRAKSVEDPVIEIPSNVLAAEDKAREAASEGDREGTEVALEERKDAIMAWDRRKLRYRMLNTFGMPGLLALYGVFRWQNRKRRRTEVTI